LDNKGLSKEADYVDRIIKKCSSGAPTYHPARQFVLKEFNGKSSPCKDCRNPINMFGFDYQEEYVIEKGIVFNDYGSKFYFHNNGSGKPPQQEAELEFLFPGITSSKGVMLNKDNIYHLQYNPTLKILTVIYDD